MPADKPEVEQTSFRLDKALLKELRKAVVDRDVTLQEAAAAGLRMWLDGKAARSQKDSSQPLIKGDMLSSIPANMGNDWTAKELADAQQFIEMRRAEDRVSISSLDALLDRWKLKHGDAAAQSRDDKRRRA